MNLQFFVDPRRRAAPAPMQKLCELATRSADRGSLHVLGPGGARWTLGRGEPQASLRVAGVGVLLHILRNPALHLGETYMDGLWQPLDGGLPHVLEVCLRNAARLDEGIGARLRAFGSRLGEWNNTVRSRRNVAHHYDLPAELYRDFLDADLHYSCAYFRDAGATLEQAQQDKCELIARKLDLRPDARVLDIGCGFGSLALYLARTRGARVTGITLSQEQLAVARERAAHLGLAGLADFELLDYRQARGQFDAIVSVGMFEHVGRPQYASFFGQVCSLLAPDGVALVHTIGRSTLPGGSNPWIRKYIFPGSYIPAASEVTSSIERAGLKLADLEIWRGRHYATTLRHWQQRFERAHGKWLQRQGERFCRMWEFYLYCSEACFEWGDLVVMQAQLVRDPARLPLTRDYLYP